MPGAMAKLHTINESAAPHIEHEEEWDFRRASILAEESKPKLLAHDGCTLEQPREAECAISASQRCNCDGFWKTRDAVTE